MGYRSEIQGLRAIAVLAVIVNHFGRELLPGGYLGVDVFFVISGYVITASLASRPATGAGEMLLDFYVRRMKRLLPALLVFIATTSVLLCLFSPRPGQSLATAMFALFGLSNLYLVELRADYFGDAVQLNPFTHTWSLGVEEQFYLVYPALLCILGFATARQRTRLVAVLALLSVLSLAAFVALSQVRSDLAYYLMPARWWELAAGALCFWAIGTRNLPPWVGNAALAGLVLVLFLPETLQVPATALACALTVAVIACIRAGSIGHQLLSSRVMVYLGTISYSLYLWHWGLLVIGRWTVGVHWWSIPLLLLLTLAAAALSYRFVEQRARHAAWSLTRWREAAVGAGTASVALGLVFALADGGGGKLYAGQRPALASTGIATLVDPHSVAGTTWSGLPCVLGHPGQVGRAIDLKRCTLGDFDQARRRTLVIGDSFAASYTPAFDALVAQDGHAVALVAAWGAGIVPEIAGAATMREVSAYYWRAVVPSLLARLRRGDSVLLLNDLASFAPPQPSAQSRERLATLEAGLRRLSDALAARGIRLVVHHGLPMMREANCDPAMAARQWFSPTGGPCRFLSREETLQRRSELHQVLGRLQGEGRLAVADLLDVFCPGPVCDFQARDGTLLYRDMHSHPSPEAARMAAPVFRQVLAGPAG